MSAFILCSYCPVWIENLRRTVLRPKGTHLLPACHRCPMLQTVQQDVSQSQSHITTDSQSASPSCCQTPIWDRDKFSFLLEILFRQLLVCYFVAPSLTRGRVCNLLLLFGLARAVPLGSALSDERSGLFLTVSFYSQLICTVNLYKL
jgi:hypothetical protein